MPLLPNRPKILSSPPFNPISTTNESPRGRGDKLKCARDSLAPKCKRGVFNWSQSTGSYSNSPISLQSPDIIEVENFLFAYEITFEVDKHVNECNFFLFLHLEISENFRFW